MRAAAVAALAAALLLPGCTLTPGCYVGLNLFPPSPIVICGFDGEPKDD